MFLPLRHLHIYIQSTEQVYFITLNIKYTDNKKVTATKTKPKTDWYFTQPNTPGKMAKIIVYASSALIRVLGALSVPDSDSA